MLWQTASSSITYRLLYQTPVVYHIIIKELGGSLIIWIINWFYVHLLCRWYVNDQVNDF